MGRTTVAVLPTVIQRDEGNLRRRGMGDRWNRGLGDRWNRGVGDRWDRGVERTSTRAHVERRVELARTVWTEMTANSLEGRCYETGSWCSVTLEGASSLISGVFIPDTVLLKGQSQLLKGRPIYSNDCGKYSLCQLDHAQ